jgi:hypothetical protein
MQIYYATASPWWPLQTNSARQKRTSRLYHRAAHLCKLRRLLQEGLQSLLCPSISPGAESCIDVLQPVMPKALVDGWELVQQAAGSRHALFLLRTGSQPQQIHTVIASALACQLLPSFQQVRHAKPGTLTRSVHAAESHIHMRLQDPWLDFRAYLYACYGLVNGSRVFGIGAHAVQCVLQTFQTLGRHIMGRQACLEDLNACSSHESSCHS